MMMSEAVREVEEYLNATSAYLFRITKAELVRVGNRYQYVVEIEEYGQGASTYTVSVDENGVLKNSRGEDLIEGRIASSIDPEEARVFEDLKSKWVKNVEGKWINTDDMQRCRYLGNHKYHLIEADEINDDSFLVSEDMIVDMTPGGEWIDKDGNMTPEMKGLYSSYYKDERALEAYEPDDKEQILAEIVYEQTSVLNTKEDPMTETQVMDYLETFCTEHS